MALLAILAPLASTAAMAAEFKPTGPVSIITQSGPGGGNDVFGRALISAIEKEKLNNVRYLMLNKVGGGSTNAMNFLKDKAGDPLSLGLFASVFITDPLVQEEATTTMAEMTPIANLIVEPALFVVKADSPFKTLKDFIEAAKANPGKYKQSGGSPLARDAVVRIVMMSATGANWSLISFPTGGERISGILGGHTDLMVLEASEAGELVRAGKLRAIAQVADKRIAGFPDVPTVKEAGYDVKLPPQARGIVGPPNMPPEAVAYYAGLLRKVTQSPTWKKYLEETQVEDAFMPPDQLKTFLKDYTDQMRGIIKTAGIEVVR
jgi:putative tricarboxylic transport membrane protein